MRVILQILTNTISIIAVQGLNDGNKPVSQRANNWRSPSFLCCLASSLATFGLLVALQLLLDLAVELPELGTELA